MNDKHNTTRETLNARSSAGAHIGDELSPNPGQQIGAVTGEPIPPAPPHCLQRKRHKKVTRPSWRDVAVAEPATVAHVIDGMPLVMRAVYELSELDPSLFRTGERLRLRLLVDRLVGHTGTEDVGNAIRDLYVLRRRGFPMSAINDTPPARKSRDACRQVLQHLRGMWGRLSPDKLEETLWVEKTLDFLETRSRQ